MEFNIIIMKIKTPPHLIVRLIFTLFLLTPLCELTIVQQVQLNPNDFVLYSNGTTGTTLIGSSITINGGSVGARRLVQTTGNVTINSNIHSGDRIMLSNSNIIKGNITAAGNFSSVTDIIFFYRFQRIHYRQYRCEWKSKYWWRHCNWNCDGTSST